MRIRGHKFYHRSKPLANTGPVRRSSLALVNGEGSRPSRGFGPGRVGYLQSVRAVLRSAASENCWLAPTATRFVGERQWGREVRWVGDQVHTADQVAELEWNNAIDVAKRWCTRAGDKIEPHQVCRGFPNSWGSVT